MPEVSQRSVRGHLELSEASPVLADPAGQVEGFLHHPLTVGNPERTICSDSEVTIKPLVSKVNCILSYEFYIMY